MAGFNFKIGGFLSLGEEAANAGTKIKDGMSTALQRDTVRNQMCDGDYKIVVHIMECRALKAVEEENQSCDPVVVAQLDFPSDLIPYYQNTPRKHNTTNPLFDYTMIFDKKSVTAGDAEHAVLTLKVKDFNVLQRDEYIGQFDFNLSAIYSRKNHEYFNQWCALMDVRQETERPCGYMKVTITVLINDDEMAVHSELESQAPAGGWDYNVTEFRDVLVPPWLNPMVQDFMAVCVELIRGEGIVALDLSAMIGLGGVDPYAKLQWGNYAPVTSSYIPGSRDPVWQQQLEVPVHTPSMLETVTLSVWDHDHIGTDDAVGAIRFKLSDLPLTLPGTCGPPIFSNKMDLFPNWFNIYGAPPEADYQSGAKSALVAYAMNHGSREGTYFRGRLLMRIWKRAHICKAEARSYDLPVDSSITQAFKSVVSGTQSDDVRTFVAKTKQPRRFDPAELGEVLYKEIAETHWTLQCNLYQAADLSLSDSGIFGGDVKIKVRVGSNERETGGAKVRDGRAEFNSQFDMALQFPKIENSNQGHSQFPDIFLYLVRGGKHIAYVRYRPSRDNWKGGTLFGDHSKHGADSTMPWWESLIEEPCIDAFGAGEIAGFLQVNLSLTQGEPKATRGGKALFARKDKRHKMYFQLYAAKFLPSKDENGLSDPYCVLKFNGYSLKSTIKKETLNPRWFEVIEADVEVPEPLGMCPPITVLVWDEDEGKADELIGRFSVPLDDAILPRDATPKPKWYPIQYEKPGDLGPAKVMAAIAMLPADHAGPPPQTIVPKAVPCKVEITAIGLRDLKPLPLFGTLGEMLGLGNIGLPVNTPFLEFDLGDNDTRAETRTSAAPSATNPNFCEQLTIACGMPADTEFLPNATLRVRDVRTANFNLFGEKVYKPLVASGTINLEPLTPWAKGYMKPRSPMIEASAEFAKKGEEGHRASKSALRQFGENAFLAMKKMKDSIGDFLDDENDLPKYLLGRTRYDNELESMYKYPPPIMEFPLFRGCEGTGMGELSVGTFKGYIRVIKEGDPTVLPLDLQDVLKSQNVCVRLYLLKGYNLPPMDLNGSCDSYPKITLGPREVEDKDRMQRETLSPNFFTSYDMSTTLPGEANLRVELWDEDTLTNNDLIGATTIDLENRWSNSEWRSYVLKPLERRTLRLPMSKMSQGKVELWVDILTPAEAKDLPMIDVMPAKPEDFELRVVVWHTSNVPVKSSSGDNKIDMQVSCNFHGYESVLRADAGTGATTVRWDYAQTYGEMMKHMEKRVNALGDLAQQRLTAAKNNLGLEANPGFTKETDVHYYCTNGRGIFNYRMVWPCTYNLEQILDKHMRLIVAVKDWDLGKDDLVGEAQIDLQPMFKAAFKHKLRNDMLHLPEPFRYAEVIAFGGRNTFDLYKMANTSDSALKYGTITLSVEVISKHVAALKPAAEGREEPNMNPKLQKPLRQLPWEGEVPLVSTGFSGCCGCGAATATDGGGIRE